MAPIILPSNQPPERFYKGGARISSFRGEPPCSPRQSEDWVASTTCCSGCADSKLGMTRLPDGRFLADAVASDPEIWLGEEHVRRFGADTKLLFKLLDAGQRLPVHAHPHVDWARKHVGARHGKAEAWYMLTGGEVHLGLKEDVALEELLDMVENQKVDEMLAKMHRIPVQPHQTVYVPPGMLHAIGEGVFIVELQEPEDLSVLCEWTGFQIDGAKDGHLGLGFKTALTAVDMKGYTEEEMAKLVTPPDTVGSVVAEGAREYFDLVRMDIDSDDEDTKCQRGFAIMAVLEGQVDMMTESGEAVPLKKGMTLVIPYGDGDFTLKGNGKVIIARPPP